MPTCSVVWCKQRSENSSLNKDNTSFHLFPKCLRMKQIWINATQQPEKWFPTKNSVICSRHFTEDSFLINEKRRLLFDNAVPTLVSPISSPETQEPQTSGTRARSLKADQALHISEDQNKRADELPEAKEIIASVYHYLQSEYENLKSFTGSSSELSPLANILARTAAATGVSEHTVSAILDHVYKISPITDEESSCGVPDDTPLEDDVDQLEDDRQEQEYELETLKMKVEIEDEVIYRPMDPLTLLTNEAHSAVEHLLSTHVTVKTEPPDVKIEPVDDDPHTKQSSQWTESIIVETGHYEDQLLNTRQRVKDKYKDRHQRYRERNREKLRQREAERRQRKLNSVIITEPTSSLNESSKSLSRLEGIQTSSGQENQLPEEINSSQKNKKYQQRYRELNREKLRQREAERRQRKRNLQFTAKASTSSNYNKKELNKDEITDANFQKFPGLKRTRTSSVKKDEQSEENIAVLKRRERQQRYREQNRDKLKQREAERRKRKLNSEIIAESSTSRSSSN